MTASESAATIFALSSAPGRSAIAVIRISGPNALSALTALGVAAPAAGTTKLAIIRCPVSGQPLDQALILFFEGPRSATGEDVAELHVHGGRAVVAAVLNALAGVPGLRPAEPGQFARQAFANGKLDLTSAEGLADLIDAETEGQRRQALAQASGALAAIYAGWRTRMIEAMALMEAAIDFSDEGDVAGDAVVRARETAEALRGELAGHLTDERRGEILRDGFRVVLAGRVNAGKSSLLNAFAGRDAAITSDEPGTTRDIIEVRLDLGGLPVIITDTAGIRDAEGAVEREGIRRSHAAMKAADLVLWLTPSGTTPSEPTPANAVYIQTKIDLAAGSPPASARAISAKTGAGLDALQTFLLNEVQARIGDIGEPLITQARHRAHVAAALRHLVQFLESDADKTEFRAEDLRLAAGELGRLTGAVDPEDVLGAIFGRFCIGK
ncbi:MAG: tRNA uridine-5-carboxymethylaminomethyl(34) synthesis GTPase MnmE [Pseudomonadota bacterium]